MWSSVLLLALVSLILAVARHPRGERVFQWLPVPLWCYGLPMALRTLGWLPADGSTYAWINVWILPVALALLLLGVDLPSVSRVSLAALQAMLVGALAIVLGGPLLLMLLRPWLPAEAWQGVGMLAATWTGGSLNMVAVQATLNTPSAVFAPLVVVDALVAYGWMACLVAAKGAEHRINHWLRAEDEGTLLVEGPTASTVTGPAGRVPGALLASALALACRWVAQPLPTGQMVASSTGWTVLVVTTASLAFSCVPAIRRFGHASTPLGYPCLYVVLAALGAQASFTTLLATPAWLVLGIGWVAVHALALLAAGRLLRMPLGVLATASQANVGGVVSAPLVGAVYHQRLAAAGLILAILGNALGTYLGLTAATLARRLAGG